MSERQERYVAAPPGVFLLERCPEGWPSMDGRSVRPCEAEARYVLESPKRRAPTCNDHLTRVVERETAAAPDRRVAVQRVGL